MRRSKLNLWVGLREGKSTGSESLISASEHSSNFKLEPWRGEEAMNLELPPVNFVAGRLDGVGDNPLHSGSMMASTSLLKDVSNLWIIVVFPKYGAVLSPRGYPIAGWFTCVYFMETLKKIWIIRG